MEPIRTLVIDDERSICEACRSVLVKRGHIVDVRMSGKEGLEAILAGTYDVTLLDIKLPDIDGMEILRRVQKEKAGEHIVVMTGYSTVRNAVESMKLGALDYLSKPFDDDQLVLAVERGAEKKRLMEENLYLRKELLDRYSFENIVGESPKIFEIFDAIRRVAPTDSTVLIYGESGTGKELFSRAIHNCSERSRKPFVSIDCSTLAPGLLESELFGHVKGAFTGAVQDKAGIFAAAGKGTLFLDDVANLGPELQAKLLRVLETKEYKPVGSDRISTTEVRIIAATNKDLGRMVKEGTFREDLYYRLNVFPVCLPPLRERKEDIPKLAYHFMRFFCRKTGKRLHGFTDDALEVLINHPWPGNVRELKNVVERLVIMADRGVLNFLDLMHQLHAGRSLEVEKVPTTMEALKVAKRAKKLILKHAFGDMEKAFLMQALEESGGNITRAAAKTGMQRSNFSALMKRHGIEAGWGAKKKKSAE
ncbi:MAG: sigma-54-dependent Fis family transcriptional regulator [Deltaproteobacteria bacterium]|nr:sigma-54-dependent Fis family transcriptional regulator [Deltaproteobacteria bacterium]